MGKTGRKAASIRSGWWVKVPAEPLPAPGAASRNGPPAPTIAPGNNYAAALQRRPRARAPTDGREQPGAPPRRRLVSQLILLRANAGPLQLPCVAKNRFLVPETLRPSARASYLHSRVGREGLRAAPPLPSCAPRPGPAGAGSLRFFPGGVVSMVRPDPRSGLRYPRCRAFCVCRALGAGRRLVRCAHLRAGDRDTLCTRDTTRATHTRPGATCCSCHRPATLRR